MAKIEDKTHVVEKKEIEQVTPPPAKPPEALMKGEDIEYGHSDPEKQADIDSFMDVLEGKKPAPEIKPVVKDEDEDEDEEEYVTEEGDEEGEDDVEEEEDEEEDIEEEVDEEEEDPLEASRAFILAQSEALLGQSSEQTTPPATPAPVTPPVPPVVTLPELTEDELEEALTDPKKFTEVLQRTLQQGIQQGAKQVDVNAAVARQINVMKTTEKFYTDNVDLVPYDSVVTLVVQNLAKQNPQKGLTEILTEAEQVVRTQLRMPKKEGKKGKKIIQPARPRKGGALSSKKRRTQDVRTSTEKQMDDMISSLHY